MNTGIDNCITSAEYLLHWEDNLRKPAAQWSETTKDKWFSKYQSRKKNLEKALIYLSRRNDSKSQKVRSILYQLDTLSAKIGRNSIVLEQTQSHSVSVPVPNNNTPIIPIKKKSRRRHKRVVSIPNRIVFAKIQDEKELEYIALSCIVKKHILNLRSVDDCIKQEKQFRDYWERETDMRCKNLLILGIIYTRDARKVFYKNAHKNTKIEYDEWTPSSHYDGSYRGKIEIDRLNLSKLHTDEMMFNGNGEFIFPLLDIL